MFITTHIVNPVNDKLTIEVKDEPGAGGAHHVYEVSDGAGLKTVIKFQSGPINENGINGLTHEVLLAIVQHRLECFQDNKFACVENAVALNYVEGANNALKQRTLARMQRGVEGQTKV